MKKAIFTLTLILTGLTGFGQVYNPGGTVTDSISAFTGDKIFIKDTLDLGGNKITGLATPTEDGEAANKKYVDTVLEDIKTSLNIIDFGATPNDDTDDDSQAINEALQEAKSGDIKSVYAPKGEYYIDSTLYIPSNVRFFGHGIDNTRIILKSSSGLDTITPVFDEINDIPDIYKYKSMIATESANYDAGFDTENIIIEGMTIDWNDNPIGGFSASPVMISHSYNGIVSNVNIEDALPSDLEDGVSRNFGNSILFAFAENCEIKNSIIKSADYESVSVNQLSDNVKVNSNIFVIDKPYSFALQRHVIQLARPTALSSLISAQYGDSISRNLIVENNTAFLKRNVRQFATAHNSDGFFINNNYIKTFSTLQDSIFLIKSFSQTENFSINSNYFDLRQFSHNIWGNSAILVGTYEDQNKPVKNGSILNNTVLIKNNDQDYIEGYDVPIIGGFYDAASNIDISNNSIYIDGYNNVPGKIFGITGYGVNVSNNTVNLSNPYETIDENGPQFLYTKGGKNININNNVVKGDVGVNIEIGNTAEHGLEKLYDVNNTFDNIKGSDRYSDFGLGVEGESLNLTSQYDSRKNEFVRSTSGVNTDFSGYGAGVQLYISENYQGILFLDIQNESLKFRNKFNGTWNPVRTVWDDSDFSLSDVNNWNNAPLLHEQTITSTELTNSGTTPVDLITAVPGIIVVERVVAKMEAQTTAYDFTNGLKITYSTYPDAIATFDNTFTNSILDAYSSIDGGSVPAHTNAGVYLESVSDPTQGDGILHLKIYYRIVEF